MPRDKGSIPLLETMLLFSNEELAELNCPEGESFSCMATVQALARRGLMAFDGHEEDDDGECIFATDFWTVTNFGEMCLRIDLRLRQ